MMSLGEVVLGGIVVSLISGVIGKQIGKYNKVNSTVCEDHRKGCTALLGQKIDTLSQRINELKKAVDNKLLGI